jgi:YYY domain-containing protein
VGTLVELTGVVPHVAYNLAVPTLAASLGSATFGAALALAARGRRPRRRSVAAGILAAAFAAVVGNLGEVEVVVRHLRGGVPLDWWYWNASRAISAPAGEPGPITEFPAFTYLYADLHAHAVALPYTAVVVALALAVVAGRRRVSPWARAGTLALVALVLGALWPTNTWDFPTYAAVVLIALVAAEGGRRAGAWRAVAIWLAVVGAACALYLPFHQAYESAFAGVARWRGARTGIADYLEVHGLFLFVIVSGLAVEVARERRLGATARLVRLLIRRPRRAGRVLVLRRTLAPRADVTLGASAVVAAALVAAAALAAAGAAVPGVILAIAVLAALAVTRRRGRDRSRGDVWRQLTVAFAVLALALTLAVELAVVDRIDIGRTNTVFKTYLQVWLLWSLAAGASLPVVWDHLRDVRRRWRVAWRSSFVVLLAATLLYPALATPAKVRDRFDRSAGRTLDGAAFMASATYADKDVEMPLADDLAGIRWMWTQVPGSPIVAEANTSPKLYGWGNRFAMFTGNPSVVGWDFHERQQRGIVADARITERINDVQRAYETTDADEAARLLARYGVEYVIVGRLERAYHPGGQAKWEAADGRLWDVVFRHGALAILRTRR